MTECIPYEVTEGNQKEAAQDDILVTDKSLAEVVYILQHRDDRNIALVTVNRQCQTW